MVHSGGTSPMNTTSALPLPASATAPPPAAGTEQAHIKPTSISDPVLANAQSPVSNESKSMTSALTKTPAQPVFNGRTSGRKRTPKSCDCCGPNSRGHNVQTVQTPSRGRGRARGRPRGRGIGDTLEKETPKRKVGGLVTQNKPSELPKTNLSESEGTKMGADSPSQNSIEMHVPEKDKVTMNCVPSPAKESHKKRLIENESVNNSDIEMKVLDKTVAASPCSPVKGTPLSTTGETKRKIEDNVVNSSTNVPVPSIANKQAKLEHVVPPVPKSPSQNVNVKLSTNGLQSSNKDEVKSQVRNGPLQSGTKPGDTSAVELILLDQASDETNSVQLTLSNGGLTTPTDDTQEVTLVVDSSVTSRPAPVPPPSHGPIAVSSEQHPWALRDHWTYCQSGTWDKVGQTEETGARKLDDKTQAQEEAEGESERLLDMIHEFLESFYVKYGSFIPLAEADVVEHLKKQSTTDFSNKGLNIEKEVKQYIAGLASAPVAGFMVTHNKHTLSLEDLSTLEEQNWINDQIINMYGELIMEATEQRVHFFNSFFHKQLVAKGYEGVKRWTKKIDLFSKWLVLIPIHLEIHWSLVTVSMAHKTISYYDSQGIVFRHTTENIMKYLLAEAKEKKQTAFQKGWKITIIKGIPQQKNDSDCGVFVLEYCRCLSVKQPFRFSQEDMPRIRKRIYKELCDCRLDV